MANLWLSKRTLAASVLLFFTACQTPCIPQWEGTTISGKCIHSERLIFRSTSFFSNITLEYTFYPAPLYSKFFINLPSIIDEVTTIPLTFIFDDKVLEVEGDLFKGGERIALSDEITLILISRLEEGQSFIIKVLHYELHVTPQNFHLGFHSAPRFRSVFDK